MAIIRPSLRVSSASLSAVIKFSALITLSVILSFSAMRNCQRSVQVYYSELAFCQCNALSIFEKLVCHRQERCALSVTGFYHLWVLLTWHSSLHSFARCSPVTSPGKMVSFIFWMCRWPRNLVSQRPYCSSAPSMKSCCDITAAAPVFNILALILATAYLLTVSSGFHIMLHEALFSPINVTYLHVGPRRL